MYALVSLTKESTFRMVLAKDRTHVFKDIIWTDDHLFLQSEKAMNYLTKIVSFW